MGGEGRGRPAEELLNLLHLQSSLTYLRLHVKKGITEKTCLKTINKAKVRAQVLPS